MAGGIRTADAGPQGERGVQRLGERLEDRPDKDNVGRGTQWRDRPLRVGDIEQVVRARAVSRELRGEVEEARLDTRLVRQEPGTATLLTLHEKELVDECALVDREPAQPRDEPATTALLERCHSEDRFAAQEADDEATQQRIERDEASLPPVFRLDREQCGRRVGPPHRTTERRVVSVHAPAS